MDLELDAGGRGLVSKDRLLAEDFAVRVHRAPLKRSVRLWHVRRHADRHASTPVTLDASGHLERPGTGSHDVSNVVVLFGGKPDHEVELHLAPPPRKHALGGFQELLLGDVLVHHIAHALAPRLRCKRQAAGALPLQVVEHVFAEPVGAKRRDAQRHLMRGERFDRLAHEGRNRAVVGRRERGQGGFVIAGFLNRPHHRVDDRLGLPLADGAVDHARLAKTAAFGAAARDFDRRAVEDRLAVGDGAVDREGEVVQVLDERAVDGEGGLRVLRLDDPHLRLVRRHAIVEGGHIEAAELCNAKQALGAGQPLALHVGPGLHQLRQLRLAVAD